MDTKNLKVLKDDGSKALIKSTILESENEAKIKIELLETAVIDEVVVFDEDVNIPLDCPFYGDGYQMLASYVGELGDIYKNSYSTFDSKFQLPQKDGVATAYNYIVIEAPDGYRLFGATSCNSYRTEFRVNGNHLTVAQIFENKEYTGGNYIYLEGFAIIKGDDISKVFDHYATLIERNHPRRKFKEDPDGWCTWYTFGPDVTLEQIEESVSVIKQNAPYLKYIQIDDGYEPHYGDWLEVKSGFDSDMKTVCQKIKDEGFEVGIWIAPFVASGNSRVFKENPDWFIKDDNGQPLNYDDAAKPGWRDIPWYVLDPTNPEALRHIVNFCKVMKNEWGASYFKLDANVWGALPFGHRYNDKMTSVEAYRYGMQAICDALGDSYILVCTAPFWPSLGLANSIRTSADIVRSQIPLLRNVKENMHRMWQNQRLWLVDPDVIISDSEPTLDKELVKMHCISIAAGGGVKMYGENPMEMLEKDSSFLQRLIRHKNIPAKMSFDLSEGITETEDYTDYFYFNFSETDSKTFKSAPKSALDVYANKMVFPNGTIMLKPLTAEWLRIKK